MPQQGASQQMRPVGAQQESDMATKIRLPMVSANLTTVKVVECAEVIEHDVEVVVECAGCGNSETGCGESLREAHKHLREKVKGWGVIFDREVNDGDYPYCPSCIKSIFPNLQARLRAEALGKPLPPIGFSKDGRK